MGENTINCSRAPISLPSKALATQTDTHRNQIPSHQEYDVERKKVRYMLMMELSDVAV